MKYTVGQLSTKLESLAITDNNDATILSPFEKLPSEIIHAIFACAPEAICNLRHTSRALRGLVDEFVRQRTTIPLVHQIQISDRFNRNYSNDNEPGTLRLWLDVPVQTASLFELRLKCQGMNLVARMNRWDFQDRGPGYMNKYGLNIDIRVGNETNDWECLVAAMGARVVKVALSMRREETNFATVCKLIGQIRFAEMKLDMTELSETKTEELLEIVELKNVESLSVTLLEVSTPSLLKFLREIASLLRSLHIQGESLPIPTENDVKWAPLIIEMFSRRLDMLHLANHEYLSRADADLLIARLPYIGKKAWFKAPFSQNSTGRSNKRHGHVIHETCPVRHPNKPIKERELSIIHKSRLNEISPRGY